MAGWWRGDGALWLAAMLAAVTLVDCAIGIVRRRSYADLVGVELGAVLVAMLIRSDDVVMTAAVACCLRRLAGAPPATAHASNLIRTPRPQRRLSSAAAARTACCQSPAALTPGIDHRAGGDHQAAGRMIGEGGGEILSPAALRPHAREQKWR